MALGAMPDVGRGKLGKLLFRSPLEDAILLPERTR